MRVRILYTNGQKTVDLFWLSHDGKDVYCGSPGFEGHRSYHKSGEVHSKTSKSTQDEGWHAPLSQLKRQFHLTTIALGNSPEWFKGVAETHVYKGGKSDSVLVIDSRSIPEGQPINVAVGLLEPGNFKVLGSILRSLKETGTEAKQLLLSTAVVPWVYIMLLWIEKPPNVTPANNL
jgi:hypothetical protein